MFELSTDLTADYVSLKQQTKRRVIKGCVVMKNVLNYNFTNTALNTPTKAHQSNQPILVVQKIWL